MLLGGRRQWKFLTRFAANGCANTTPTEFQCGPPLSSLTSSQLKWMENSVNVISLNILESDVGYPISVYSTVVARDEIDYRFIYLFRHNRDDPQVITLPKDMLTLTGPHRGLAVTDSMFFEIDLKITDGGTVDRDFSKGVIEHNAIVQTKQPISEVLISWLRTMELVYTPVPKAVEASLTVKVLNGPSNFNGKVTAWTTEDNKNHIILYDSEAAGTVTATGEDGCVVLSRCLVAVPLNKESVLNICDGDQEDESMLQQSDRQCVCKLGSYELIVTVNWTGGMIRRRRPNMF